MEQLQQEIEGRQAELKELQDDPERKVGEADVAAALEFLGRKNVQPQEITDMIWEVDENLDGFVDWKEFQLMFLRNISDTTGLEPSKFYNLVQFMIYDKDSKAMVSVDNTMKMLYERCVRFSTLGSRRANSNNGTTKRMVRSLTHLP
jgi:Ca2+-binding EF-hand superfamily protein